jgi:hypothetical protein
MKVCGCGTERKDAGTDARGAGEEPVSLMMLAPLTTALTARATPAATAMWCVLMRFQVLTCELLIPRFI